jgi:hypothetical protein
VQVVYEEESAIVFLSLSRGESTTSPSVGSKRNDGVRAQGLFAWGGRSEALDNAAD